MNNDRLAVAEAVLAVQPATAEAALKDWIVFDAADEVTIDMLTGEDGEVLAEEGDDDQSDDRSGCGGGADELGDVCHVERAGACC